MLFAGLNLVAGEKMCNLKIVLKSSSSEVTAVLDDKAVTRSFATQLPLNLSDYAGHEKVVKLPKPLDASDELGGIEGKKGEVSYFALWTAISPTAGYRTLRRDRWRCEVAKDGDIKIKLARYLVHLQSVQI